jgi:hypothetical protein
MHFGATAHRVNTNLHPLEEAMNKSPVAIVVAILAAATFFSSSAQAGFGIRLGFGGPLPSFVAHGNGGGGYSSGSYRKRYVARCHKKKEKTYAKRKVSEPKVAKVDKVEKVAKVEKVSKPKVIATAPVIEPDVIADSENSSITAAAIDPAETTAATEPETAKPVEVKAEAKTTEPKREKTASKLDCKKFFPSVGMTLTVPCE